MTSELDPTAHPKKNDPSEKLGRRKIIGQASALMLLGIAGCAQPTAPAAPQPTQQPQAPASVALTTTSSVSAPAPTASAPTDTVSAPAKAQVTAAPSAVGIVTSAPTLVVPTPNVPANASPVASAKVQGLAELAVVRGGSAESITRAAVDALGGIARFVPKGSIVVIKPNICVAQKPEYAATTNPEVIAAIIKMAKEAGASEIKVLDFGWSGQTRNYKESGIEDVVKAAGAQMVNISQMKWKATPNPKGKALKSVEVYDDVLSADVLINVPIAKTHSLASLTIGMKNLMGVIRYREALHGNLSQNLADLCALVKPTLTIVDAVRILVRNGPSGGSLDDVRRLDTVIASADIVAADAYATTLFDKKPDALNYVRTAQNDGLGVWDLSKLKIAEIKL